MSFSVPLLSDAFKLLNGALEHHMKMGDMRAG